MIRLRRSVRGGQYQLPHDPYGLWAFALQRHELEQQRPIAEHEANPRVFLRSSIQVGDGLVRQCADDTGEHAGSILRPWHERRRHDVAVRTVEIERQLAAVLFFLHVRRPLVFRFMEIVSRLQCTPTATLCTYFFVKTPALRVY